MSGVKFVEEFRDGAIARGLARRIAEVARGLPEVRLMEVCGTHTMAIYRNGIRQLLPENIVLISGPGCPVCVTPNDYIDRAIAFARRPDVTVCTFGDMVRVPGSSSSLELEKSRRADVRVVYSPLDAVEVAVQNPGRKVVFLGVGFETTAPTVAAAIELAAAKGVDNFFVSSAHKVMPPALAALTADARLGLKGFILPAHVSAIIGVVPYQFLAAKHGMAGVIAGFEPLDILQGILMLVEQVAEGRAAIEVQYTRVVREEGNPRALALLERVFQPCDAEWRGLGMIAGSGLAIRAEYAAHQAEANIIVEPEQTVVHPSCRCGEVLRGLLHPRECPLFGTVCTPETPVGACMVSTEGTCAACYKYGAPAEEGSVGG
ncbi:MAG: hydrogenase formation protein HypD [Calditrichaeota bacterium]|nr:hydrogenase formation protein HypD [Calditrichota bacterium]